MNGCEHGDWWLLKVLGIKAGWLPVPRQDFYTIFSKVQEHLQAGGVRAKRLWEENREKEAFLPTSSGCGAVAGTTMHVTCTAPAQAWPCQQLWLRGPCLSLLSYWLLKDLRTRESLPSVVSSVLAKHPHISDQLRTENKRGLGGLTKQKTEEDLRKCPRMSEDSALMRLIYLSINNCLSTRVWRLVVFKNQAKI